VEETDTYNSRKIFEEDSFEFIANTMAMVRGV